MYQFKKDLINIYIMYLNKKGVYIINFIIILLWAEASGLSRESTCSSRSLWGKAC